jgi:hypothetical protein
MTNLKARAAPRCCCHVCTVGQTPSCPHEGSNFPESLFTSRGANSTTLRKWPQSSSCHTDFVPSMAESAGRNWSRSANVSNRAASAGSVWRYTVTYTVITTRHGSRMLRSSCAYRHRNSPVTLLFSLNYGYCTNHNSNDDDIYYTTLLFLPCVRR